MPGLKTSPPGTVKGFAKREHKKEGSGGTQREGCTIDMQGGVKAKNQNLSSAGDQHNLYVHV